MCAGGEYRGVRHDRAFQRPFASAFAFNPRASPQSCRAEDPEQATFQRVDDLANPGAARDHPIRRSSRQKTGVFRYRRNHGGTHGENQNFEHGSGVDISGEAQRFRWLPAGCLDCDRADGRRRMGSRDDCEGARGLPSLRKAHRANSEAAPRDLRSGGGLNISRQKMRGAPPNGLWELQN